MADEDELYLANLDEFVNDENRIVTYKWLSRTLSVPANKAKQMLYAFVQKQKGSKSGSDLNITYIIGGRCSMDGDIVQRFVITQDENLEETKRNFSLVTSLHIYSIQKCRLKDLNSLYTVDYDVQQQHDNASNRWSHIHCSAAVPLADKGANRGTTSMNGVTDGDKGVSTKMVNGTGEAHTSHSASKGTSNSATDQKAKMTSSKPKKGQMSAIEMFATKSSSKPDKNSSDKPRDAKNVKDNEAGEAKPDSANKGGSMMSFFGKTTTAKKAPEKPGTTGNEKEVNSAKSETAPEKPNQASESKKKKKRELSSEDEEEPLPPKISKVVKSNVEESKDLKGDKKKVEEKQSKQAGVTKSGKAGKKKAVINESDEEPEEKPKKRRKRMKELPKEDSSDDEQDVTNADSNKGLLSDQGSPRSVSPPPQQQPQQTENGTARRRKRTKKLKDKTYMNDEGFMVTEKVWENDSTDASDEELQITNPPVDENKPSPAKKPNKKTYADVKNKTAKQSSLTSFFKKS